MIRRTRITRDAYGALLIAILATLVLLGFGKSVGVLTTGLQGMTLLFALWTAEAHRHLRRVAAVLVAASIALSAASNVAENRVVDTAVAVTGVLMALGAIIAIFRRISVILRISRETVYAVLAAYLLLGLLFAYLFLAIATATGVPFFTGRTTTASFDFIYFSFTTITTVGFGDFTPATRLGQMLSASEAVVGQLYLVSVVGLVVGNFGRLRDPKANR